MSAPCSEQGQDQEEATEATTPFLPPGAGAPEGRWEKVSG